MENYMRELLSRELVGCLSDIYEWIEYANDSDTITRMDIVKLRILATSLERYCRMVEDGCFVNSD